MYDDSVKASGFLDNDARRALTIQYFEPIQRDCGQNLIFYYTNYSNPFSEDEAPRYVLIGVSRVVQVGEELTYENVTERIAQKYAGGMVWARNITSSYPAEGLRLPYHRYMDDPERLQRIALLPENPLLCKFGSKHVSDDEAIGLLEQFLAKVRDLRALGDQTEDWTAREAWLLKTIAELWRHRGLYPGLLRALDAAGAAALIESVKAISTREGDVAAHALAFEALDTGRSNAVTDKLSKEEMRKLSRNWRLRDDGERMLLRDVLPRLDLSADTMQAIASEERANVGLNVSAAQIASNPYLLAEHYVGEGAADRIAWSAIDRGTLPSPDLGGRPLAEVDYNDERRFRALCVEHLRGEANHTFRLADDLVREIGKRMNRLPAWKQAAFTTRYFDVDAEFLSESLTMRPAPPALAVYIRSVFEDERRVEEVLTELASRPDIDLRRPVTEENWAAWVRKAASPLALKAAEAYAEAVKEQAAVCSRLFRSPLSVVTGAAGTGKTSVIEALVRAVRRTEGEGASILVLAPTGKAADRAREVFEKASLNGVQMVTVHSFLASNGWLNDNLTFKRTGGKNAAVGTLILDEASMLDLELAGALFRAVEWNSVRRLVLVGDAGQLPPIGRGRVFADVIRWLAQEQPDSLGCLTRNLRQLLNKVEGQGCAIVALSELFIVEDDDKTVGGRDASTTLEQEALIAKLHEGGAVDRDLDVIYWNEPAGLADILIGAVEDCMRAEFAEDVKPSKLWDETLRNDPTAYQILTPHRGELHGVEWINQACQKRIHQWVIDRIGAVDGITLFDKVIQVRNRPASNRIWAYDFATKQNVQVEAFNGEIGLVETFKFDDKVWDRLRNGKYGLRLQRFTVRFTRKPGLAVGYGREVPPFGKYKRNEKVEDNLELAYAVSVHKAQGSEFAHTFVVIPAGKGRSLSPELVYTAITRASRHCTLLIQRDVGSLLDARRRENAQTPQINSWLFELHLTRPELVERSGWYEAGKIHEAVSGDMVRSKSEVIIANLLHQHQVPFRYETLLFAGDGTVRLPDFTIAWQGETFYWEHLGRLDLSDYADAWARKRAWYDRWFPRRLLTTEEGPQLSRDAVQVIERLKGKVAMA